MRKANEAVQSRPTMHTPQEFSRLKYERECKMHETAKAYRQQILQHQKVDPLIHDFALVYLHLFLWVFFSE